MARNGRRADLEPSSFSRRPASGSFVGRPWKTDHISAGRHVAPTITTRYENVSLPCCVRGAYAGVDMFTDSAPQRVASKATSSRKPRIRRRTLTRLDLRTSLAKRIAELKALFTASLAAGGETTLSPLRLLKVEQAAHALAVAELARGRYMRDGDGDLAELLTAERRADAAVKRLGLPYESPRPAPSSASAAPAHDLSQLSNSQLDRLYALLAEASPRAPSEACQANEASER
jgi:hypothetical protein